jgi:hypothetical protein
MRKLASKFAFLLVLAPAMAPSISAAPAESSGSRVESAASSSVPRFALVSSSVGPQASLAKGREDTTTTSNASAQSLGPIDPYVIAGGGGSSSGGNFALDGTIGQAAAGALMSGSTYSLSSGFWNTVSGTTTVVVKRRRSQITSQ